LAQVDEIKGVKPRRARWISLGVIPTVLVAVAVTFRNPLFHGNFGVVEPERVYRSAQPVKDLPRLIERYGLRSILNLRGGSYDNSWYTAEVRATGERGVDFYDLPLSATRRPYRREMLILLDLFERCRYPLLIHCKSGSDRTGLATALYRMSRLGESPDQALRAFSLQYGHVPLGGPEHLHEPLQEYGAWLKARRLIHRPEHLRAWIERVYVSDSPERQVPSLQPGPRKPRPGAPPATGP
jgi:protein tyrosine phosphatase (PTP) superfamily phosphohydrolase (DUF442 family)